MASNISRPSSVRVDGQHPLEVLDDGVVALGSGGELRITVSDMTAPSSIIARGRLGSIPFWRKRSTTSVAVEPTGSKVAVTGTRVSIEPM